MNGNTTYIDDMKLTLLPPVEKVEISQEEAETETIKFLAIFVKIKQRVLRENKNHHQYMMSSR